MKGDRLAPEQLPSRSAQNPDLNRQELVVHGLSTVVNRLIAGKIRDGHISRVM